MVEDQVDYYRSDHQVKIQRPRNRKLHEKRQKNQLNHLQILKHVGYEVVIFWWHAGWQLTNSVGDSLFRTDAKEAQTVAKSSSFKSRREENETAEDGHV